MVCSSHIVLVFLPCCTVSGAKGRTAPGLPYSSKTKVSFLTGYQALLEYSSVHTP